MVDYIRIYATQAAQYEALVTREDYAHNIRPALESIHPFAGLRVIELGAGTGRLTRLFTSETERIFAFDISIPMLIEARSQLEANRRSNYALGVADNRQIPASDDACDLIVVGWSLGHFVSWYPDSWLEEINRVLLEMKRVLRPGGTIIILETLGTGQKQPKPPTRGLANYYAWLENDHGFSSTWIRTDYRFASAAEAEHLTRFFFGDELADQIVLKGQLTLPECTGIWWLTDSK